MDNVERLTDSLADAALPPSGNVRGDIDDEIGDHLALAARDLQLAGHGSDEARQVAVAKFGDIEQIRRKCWWIQQGDAVMARLALGLAIAVLIVAVVGLAIGGWRMNSAINDLGDTLAAINETQKALLDRKPESTTPAAAQDLTINGRLYVGDKPAGYADVYLFDLAKNQLIDHLYADEEGRFVSKPLPAGPYFVLAPLVGKDNPLVDQGTQFGPFANKHTPLFAIQSEPVNVYPWSKRNGVEIDVKMFRVGEVSFELNRPIPKVMEAEFGDSSGAYPTLILVIPAKFKHAPLPAIKGSQTEGEYAPVSWVIGCSVAEITSAYTVFEASLNNLGALVNEGQVPGPIRVSRWKSPTYYQPKHIFPEGEYEIGAFLYLGIGNPITSGDFGPTIDLMNKLQPDARTKIKVIGGERTHLRIALPDDFEESARRAISEASGDAKKLMAALYEKPFAVTIQLLGQQELIDELPNKGRLADGSNPPKTEPVMP